VLGYDDSMSTDHDWKPRVLLFLREDEYGDAVRDVLRQQVPSSFADRPTGRPASPSTPCRATSSNTWGSIRQGRSARLTG
jgi:hypothetical protein